MSYKWPDLRLFNRLANTAGFSACIVQIFKAPGKNHAVIAISKRPINQSSSAFLLQDFPEDFLANGAAVLPPGDVSCPKYIAAWVSPWQPVHPQVLRGLSVVFLPGHPKLAWGPGSLASLEPVLFI